MLKDLARLLVSDSCYGCGELLSGDERYICLGCLSRIEQTGFHLHPADNELYLRLAGRVPLAGAAALFYFDKGGQLQQIIQALKYGDAPQVGVYLGELYGGLLRGSAFAAGLEALVPVPLHRSRLIQRGYNQSEQIAIGIGRALGVPVRTDLVRRARRTLTQTRKSNAARWDNVREAFAAAPAWPASVLLIDDIITTGATLEACIRAICAAAQPPAGIRIASIGMARMH